MASGRCGAVPCATPNPARGPCVERPVLLRRIWHTKYQMGGQTEPTAFVVCRCRHRVVQASPSERRWADFILSRVPSLGVLRFGSRNSDLKKWAQSRIRSRELRRRSSQDLCAGRCSTTPCCGLRRRSREEEGRKKMGDGLHPLHCRRPPDGIALRPIGIVWQSWGGRHVPVTPQRETRRASSAAARVSSVGIGGRPHPHASLTARASAASAISASAAR